MKTKKQRNWSQYNQRLKRHARVELFLSDDGLSNWNYAGERSSGGKICYGDNVIEACLLIREYFGLPLRQTEGFVQSLLDMLFSGFKSPDYTTLSRRCSSLKPVIAPLMRTDGLVIAVDSTGLSVHNRSEWNRLKHGKGHGKGSYKYHDKWRKLHIAIDTDSGLILSAGYTNASASDSDNLPPLLEALTQPVNAVCADMAYDSLNCRRAIYQKGARQLIPPRRRARLCKENRNLKSNDHILKERDDAINYIRHNTINGDLSAARAAWKQKTGYHARSLVETTMSQIKAHTSDKLSNRLETNRNTQALLKCKLINKLIAE